MSTSINKSSATSKIKLAEFYAVAKENLTKLKKEVLDEQVVYESHMDELKKLKLEYQELLKLKEKKETEHKGAEEKRLIYLKYKADLDRQLQELSTNKKSNWRDLETLRLATEDKVKKVKGNEDDINSLKNSQVDTLDSRIQKEKDKNKEILEKIKEVNNKIEEYKLSLSEVEMSDNKKGDEFIKDTAEMNKFLSEL